MRYLITFALMISASFAQEYGAKVSKEKSITLIQAIDSMKSSESDHVVVSAKVGKVCEKKGCWMTLESKNKDIRVTFKDYSFFVPLSLIGKNVLIEGKLKSHTMSLKEAKHFAEDAGQDPKKITKPVTEYRMIASGVKVL